MSLQFTQYQQRIIIGLDDIIDLFKPDSHFLLRSNQAHIVPLLPIISRHRGILTRPLEVRMSLSLIHILGDIQHDNVIETLHFHRYSSRMRCSRFAQDELELNVLTWLTRLWIYRFRVSCVGGSNEVSSFVRYIDGEDSDEDIDGGE